MYIAKESLDDLLREVIKAVMQDGTEVDATKGKNKEINGVLLELTNPRARLSRSETKGTIFSLLGEFLWYMSRSDDASIIDYYIPTYKEKFSDDGGKTIHGAYGPRLFGMRGTDQVKNVIKLLKAKGTSRRAVIQLFNAEDIMHQYLDIPCTCSLQLLIRDGKLNLITYMRSNDAFLGLPHDIFSFTMLQELIACDLDLDLGTYKHMVGSMHVYEEHYDRARTFMDEGFHERIAMPEMPRDNPWLEIEKVNGYAEKIRNGETDGLNFPDVSEYWKTHLQLLLIYHFTKNDYPNVERLLQIAGATTWGNYKPFVIKRLARHNINL
jgi:thymidylate synthase